MKRIATILFLLVLLFNLVGYRVVLTSMKESTTAAIETKVDAADYNEADLVSIKTVLNLPYYTPSAEFERAYGSITINGKEYEYVKRRVYSDTLEVLCLPNHDKTKLKTVEQDLTKSSAEGQASTEKKGSTTVKLPMPDFFQQLATSFALPANTGSQVHPFTNTSFLADGFATYADQPPAFLHALS